MKRKKRRMRRWLKFALALALLALVSVMLLFTPLFAIKEIQVSGTGRYSADELKLQSGILPGDNGFRKLKLTPESILGLRLTDAEKALESLPYVKDATVRILFPDGLSITVTEREPAAFLSYLGNYLVVDADGYVLQVDSEPPREALMEVRGIDFSKYAIGSQLETSDIELVKIAVAIIACIKKSDQTSGFALWPVVDWIDIVDAKTALISLDKRVVVRLDPTDKLQYTIDFAKEIFFTQTNTKERGRLEFAPNQNPSFIPE